MNIGAAAEQSGLNAKTIRYYEGIGLVKPDRAQNGYRDYSENHVHRLKFVQRSRSLGFSIDECRILLSLYDDRQRSSSDVRRMALDKVNSIEKKIEELMSLRDTLSELADNCHGDSRPNCPIIDRLAGQ